jgi:uncharacterized protein (UPF0254 family)
MARFQVADGGDTLQVWRVAVNVLNKQSQTADKGLSSNLGVGRGAYKLLTVENKLLTKSNMKPRNWTDSLNK